MLNEGQYRKGLQRITRVGSLEEAQQIADALLNYNDPDKATKPCEKCGKQVEWDTLHRFVNDIDNKSVELCWECCPSCTKG